MSNDENSEISKYEIKIKIINFLELAYKSDGDITAKLIKSKGPFTLKVDKNGSASLSGKAGIVRFSVDEETDKFGIGFSFVSVMMFGNNDGKIHYTATVGFKNGPNIQITSILDVKKLILSCTGLLCRAAQALKNRHRQIDQSLEIQ